MTCVVHYEIESFIYEKFIERNNKIKKNFVCVLIEG